MITRSSKEIPIEQRPTVLTQAVFLKRLHVEQQSTLPIVLKQPSLEQQPTLPMVLKRTIWSSSMLRWIIPVLLSVMLLAGSFISQSTIQRWLSGSTSAPGIRPHIVLAQSSIQNTTARHFMDAMMHKNWSAMWSLLSPDAQQLWQGKGDFVHFEQTRFGSLQLVSYKDGPAQIQQAWLDPDTTYTYPYAATLHVSLQATAPDGLLSPPSALALSQGLFNNTLFALAPFKGKWRVLVAGPADLEAPILVPATPPTYKLLVPIFMYHHISNRTTKNHLDYGLTITTTDFDAQLTWLQQQGYQSISQTGLFDALYYGKVLPTHPMILTFDDGYQDAYTDALPILLAHHYRGVFYIITGMIGGRYMTWDQVRTLAQDGMQISSHTIHHVNIGQPPAWTSTQDELILSKQTLEAKLGQPIQFFCYPVGEPFHHDTVAEQQLVLADLFNDGYVSATLDPLSFNSAVQDPRLPYQLTRIRVSGGESLDAFIGILDFNLQIGAQRLAQE